MMKVCTGCKQEKDTALFFTSKISKDGFRPKCKECMKVMAKSYREKNKEKIKEVRDIWLTENREKYLDTCARYREANLDACRKRVLISRRKKPDYYRMKTKEWTEANKDRLRFVKERWVAENAHILRANKARRRLAHIEAMPSWADIDKIFEVYAEAHAGDGLHVDHIVPLRSKLVCGLHVHNNLQAIPGSENMSKSNRYWPDMP